MDTNFFYVGIVIPAIFLVIGIVATYYAAVVPMAREAMALRNELQFLPKFNAYHADVINTLKERELDTGVAATLKNFVLENERLTDALDTEKEMHLATHEQYRVVIEGMSTELKILQAGNEQLQADSKVLQDKLESIQFDIDVLEQNAARAEALKTAPVVAPAPVVNAGGIDVKEFRDAAEGILLALGKPKNNYETGVYNGVASTANVVINEDAFALISPAVESTVFAMPKRDAKGRFLKAA